MQDVCRAIEGKTRGYQRRQHCKRSGQVEGAAIGAGFTGSYAKVSCTSHTSEQSAERRSDYVWLPEQGIYLSLGFQQAAEATEATEKPGTALDVKGRYVSFEPLP